MNKIKVKVETKEGREGGEKGRGEGEGKVLDEVERKETKRERWYKDRVGGELKKKRGKGEECLV